MVALAIAGVAAIIGISQVAQSQGIFKPSATECKFAGQRLSENHYCSYKYLGGGEGYFEVKEIQKQTQTQTQQSEQQVTRVVGAKDIELHKQLFADELFSGKIDLPFKTGVHTINAKSLEIIIEGTTPVKVTIEGANCIIEGISFHKVCDVPSNSDVWVHIEGTGQTNLVLKSNYL